MPLGDATGRLLFCRTGGVLIFEETDNSRTYELFCDGLLIWAISRGTVGQSYPLTAKMMIRAYFIVLVMYKNREPDRY